MKKFATGLVALFLCFASNAGTGIDNSLLKEAKMSVSNATKFILSKQNKNGSWGPYGGMPAVTAICITSMATSAEGQNEKVKTAIVKGEKSLLSYVRADGSIWEQNEKGYPNYSTSLAMVALYVIDKKKHELIIKRARRWIKKSQFGDDKGIEAGGIGYGSNKSKSDLSNTQLALEALFITADIEDENTSPEEVAATKKCWSKAQAFLSRCQALPKVNDQEWAKKAPGEDFGGSIYSPDRSKVDPKTGEVGVHRVYGSMTYAGLKSMIYAGIMSDDKLIKEDPRVKAAINWASKNYTLDENPGVGAQGHFYYIQTFTKALHAYGEDTIKGKDGKLHQWRKDVVKKLLSLQKADGHWVNPEGRWMENVPVMVTAFSLSSMNYALSKNLK